MKRPAPLRHLLLALLLLAVLLCTSCQRHSAVWPQLLEAEALLDSDLPAAASLLDSLDATPLRGEDTARLAELRRQRCQYSRQAFLLTPWARRLRELEESGEELTLHDHDELRAVLADCFADTMVDLKSDCPALNMDEAYFCIYSALGLTTNTVAQCERTSNVVLRKRKSRIKEKVGADWFSLFFSA